MYDTDTSQDVVRFLDEETLGKKRQRYTLSYDGGQNCGKMGINETIYIHHLEISDPIVLGGNVTVGADVEVKRDQKTATLLAVVMEKVGLPFPVPCLGGVGSCNYTDPCDFLAKFKCPQEIIDEGWNCRCPLIKDKYAFAPITQAIPSVPLRAFLVDGTYHVKIQLFDNDMELFCYTMQASVKELQ